MNDPRVPQWALDDDAAAGRAAAFTLYDAAHARTGDKGDICNIALVAWDTRLYPLLADQVTESAVAAHFDHRRPRVVRRYLLPRLQAINFVLEGALDGGVNDALNLDTHGKSLAFLLLSLPLQVPPALRGLLRQAPVSTLPQPHPRHHDRSLP